MTVGCLLMWIRLVDFGMVVLIWIVQLVVYPGFLFYAKEDLLRWHGQYTGAITIIVMPLMLGQLCLHGWKLYNQFSSMGLVIFLLVLSTWAVTFLVSVPLHNQISSGVDIEVASAKLVSTNWIRTVQWTLIFILGLIAAK